MFALIGTLDPHFISMTCKIDLLNSAVVDNTRKTYNILLYIQYARTGSQGKACFILIKKVQALPPINSTEFNLKIFDKLR